MELSQEELNKIYTLFSYLGINQDKIVIVPSEDLISINVEVDENEAGMYIGRYASTIDSIQLLISVMLNQGDSHRHILLDIGGYRDRRTNTLKEMVDRISAEVVATGVAHALPPISSTERRQVHLMLADHEELTTYSQGDGQDRRLYIAKRV